MKVPLQKLPSNIYSFRFPSTGAFLECSTNFLEHWNISKPSSSVQWANSRFWNLIECFNHTWLAASNLNDHLRANEKKIFLFAWNNSKVHVKSVNKPNSCKKYSRRRRGKGRWGKAYNVFVISSIKSLTYCWLSPFLQKGFGIFCAKINEKKDKMPQVSRYFITQFSIPAPSLNVPLLALGSPFAKQKNATLSCHVLLPRSDKFFSDFLPFPTSQLI